MDIKSSIKTYAKKTRTAIDESSTETPELIKKTVSVLDKAAKHNVIHPNAAARKKSRLMKHANAKA